MSDCNCPKWQPDPHAKYTRERPINMDCPVHGEPTTEHLEARIEALQAENARLRDALSTYADGCDATETTSCGYEGHLCCKTARAALKGDG